MSTVRPRPPGPNRQALQLRLPIEPIQHEAGQQIEDVWPVVRLDPMAKIVENDVDGLIAVGATGSLSRTIGSRVRVLGIDIQEMRRTCTRADRAHACGALGRTRLGAPARPQARAWGMPRRAARCPARGARVALGAGCATWSPKGSRMKARA